MINSEPVRLGLKHCVAQFDDNPHRPRTGAGQGMRGEERMNVQQHIQIVRGALEKAEVGPWANVASMNGEIEVWQSIDNTGICRLVGSPEMAASNAHLIANSPAWLQQSIEIIEQDLTTQIADKDREIEELKEHIEGIHRILISADEYQKPKDMRSVLISAKWACADALSPKEEQTGG